MEKFIEKKDKSDIFKSPLKEIYMSSETTNPFELHEFYTKIDQNLMKNGSWDYKNDNLIINKIKNILETVDDEKLTEEEKKWKQEIIWFWYHHAISCAIWRYHDKKKAQEYSKKAILLQPKNHSNKITKLLHLLVNDKLKEAEKFVNNIDIEVEKNTAIEVLHEYKNDNFF